MLNFSDTLSVNIYRKAVINTKSRKLTEKEIHKVTCLGTMRIFTLKAKYLKLLNKQLEKM